MCLSTVALYRMVHLYDNFTIGPESTSYELTFSSYVHLPHDDASCLPNLRLSLFVILHTCLSHILSYLSVSLPCQPVCLSRSVSIPVCMACLPPCLPLHSCLHTCLPRHACPAYLSPYLFFLGIPCPAYLSPSAYLFAYLPHYLPALGIPVCIPVSLTSLPRHMLVPVFMPVPFGIPVYIPVSLPACLRSYLSAYMSP